MKPQLFRLGAALLLVLMAGWIPSQEPPAKTPASQTPPTPTPPNPLASLLETPLFKIAQLRLPSTPISYDFIIDSFTTTSVPSLKSGQLSLPEQPRFRMEGQAKIKGYLVDIHKHDSVWADDKWVPANETRQLFDGKRFWNIQHPATPGLWCPLRIVNRDTTMTEISKAIADAGGAIEGQFPFFPTGDWLYAALMVPNTKVADKEEPIGGFSCRKVMFHRGPSFFTIWVDMKHGGLPRQMEIIFPEKPLSYWKKKLTKRKPGEIELNMLEIRDVDIQKIGDREMPVAGTFVTRTYYRDGKREFQIQRIRLFNIVQNPANLGKFEIDLPEGTMVTAAQYPLKYEWRDGDLKPFLDPDIMAGIGASVRQIAHEASTPRHPLLRGYKLSPSDLSSSSTRAVGNNHGLDKHCYEPLGSREGLYCLYAMLRLAGVDVKPENLFRPEYLDKAEGSSLVQLEAAARKQGLHTHATQDLTARALAASPYPILLRVKRKPYLAEYDAWELFLGKRDGQAWIWNLSSSPRLEPMANLTARWNGMGLILSNAPIKLFKMKLADRLLASLATIILILLLWRIRRLFRNRGSARPVPGLSIFVRRSIIEGMGFLALALGIALLWHVLSGGGLFTTQGTRNIRLSRTGMFTPAIDINLIQRIVEGREKATLIDARNAFEFFLGHIPTAKSIPVASYDEAFHAAVADLPRDGRLVIYCSHEACHMSEYLAARMAAEGFTRLEIYKGGWAEWLESKEKTSSL